MSLGTRTSLPPLEPHAPTPPNPPGSAVPNRVDQALSGWLWLSSGAVVQGLVTIASLAVLARLLSPSDFGAVSAGMLVITFCSNLSQVLVGPALIQHPRLRADHVETGFAMALAGGVGLFGLLWLLGPAVATALHASNMSPVLRALAGILPLQGLGAVADALVRRDLAFRSIARIRIASYALGYGAVGITVALLGGGLWALVAANLSQAALNTTLLLRRRPHSKRINVSGPALRELVTFGAGLCIGKIGNYFATEGDYLVTVKWLGVNALGLYERAYQLMAMPAILVGQVLDDVLFPAIAQIQTESERVARAYRRVAAAVALFALPLSAVVLILAPDIVNVLLGPKWHDVVLPFRILAVGTLFRTSYKVSDSLTRALGAVYRRAWREWTYAAFVIGGAIIGQKWGLPGVAAAVLLALLANYLLTAQLGTSLVSLRWTDYFGAHAPGLRLALVVAIPALAIATLTRSVLELPSPVVLVATVLGTAIVTIPVLLMIGSRLLGPDGNWLMHEGIAFLLRTRNGVAEGTFPKGGGPGIYVEFVGLPGAGKSVASRKVAEALRRNGLTVTEPTYHLDHVVRPAGRRVLKASYAFRGLFGQPREGGFWSQVLWQSRQPSVGRLLAEAMNWFYLMATVRGKTAEPGVHLFDQGLCQAIWSIVYEATCTEITSQESLARLARSLPGQSVIILVEASLDTIGTRLRDRPGLVSRVERDIAAGLSATGFARAMGALARTEAAIARLSRKGRITLLRLNNDEDGRLAERADKIADVLRQLSDGRGEPEPAAASAAVR
ncbi:MAG TPA: lipopolysaccharide biosynthesis protein [Gemmatimonadales bacterium]|nr:lipopolysaccharide biosynthesis protein [Gemmatimonadales bacterium]